MVIAPGVTAKLKLTMSNFLATPDIATVSVGLPPVLRIWKPEIK